MGLGKQFRSRGGLSMCHGKSALRRSMKRADNRYERRHGLEIEDDCDEAPEPVHRINAPERMVASAQFEYEQEWQLDLEPDWSDDLLALLVFIGLVLMVLMVLL